MFSISDVNGVNVYESWYQGDSATIAPMFDKFCSYSTAKPRFCRNLEQEAMNVSILILRVHLILLRNFNWILIADISMKWRNVRII